MPDSSDNLCRYHRQMLLCGIGNEGQKRLLDSHTLIVGCGALGGAIADLLARAGVGTLTIVDRDIVDLTNLHRQVMFDEADVEASIPKAEAAKARIRRINSEVTVRACVDDFNHRNAAGFVEGIDLILDGLDNFQTRYLLNDLAVKFSLPYVYGGAVGTTGMSMPILPSPKHTVTKEGEGARPIGSSVSWSSEQATPCLRCMFPDTPPPGASPTCDTAGILGPVASMIAAHQATQALKLLSGNIDALDRSLYSIDIWTNQTRRIDISDLHKVGECPCCDRGSFIYLRGEVGDDPVHLCGRIAVQISPPQAAFGGATAANPLDLQGLARRLEPHGRFSVNRFAIRGVLTNERNEAGEPLELTVFSSGRAIVRGTDRLEVARSICSRYVGN